ncbi:hypothetical protein [Candidatus Aquiluna sp. UB-MaderosW2red]|uniref:hypothetical protein n=1 Tax=Candidatus Aquiluna sp. UB-MaderosW2red TaxID=1855377 RepID=UPI000875BF27|nr:hypothetical protein [Candidatus Aquiluna sp. UB-MaderosW2red]SCX03708.1 hypothetical protein SAMN05216534_0153 [Candidatus Aquiluna sp. UB-MaderosW2red]
MSSYEFWSLFWGWLALAAFLVPVLGAIFIQVVVAFVGMISFMFGGGQTRTGSSSLSTNDYDEDEYH